jgi:hypothetical protein
VRETIFLGGKGVIYVTGEMGSARIAFVDAQGYIYKATWTTRQVASWQECIELLQLQLS